MSLHHGQHRVAPALPVCYQNECACDDNTVKPMHDAWAVRELEDPRKLLDQAVTDMQADLVKMRQASAQVCWSCSWCHRFILHDVSVFVQP